MKKKGKVFRNALIFIILIALTFYILLKDQNPMEILKIISSAKVEFVLIGILCMFIYIVLEAVIELKKGSADSIKAVMDDLKEKRVSKQPLDRPSAGSTFKRPEGHFAGKLIMDTGLRGFSVGGAQVSEKHCGFVINKGGATAKDVQLLIKEVADRVEERFGVRLEPEVKMLGEFE